MYLKRKNGTVKEQRELDDLRATVGMQAAALEYVALMADVDLPNNDDEGGDGDEQTD